MYSDIIFISILILCLYLGVIVYRKNRYGRDNRLYIVLCMLLIFWLIANYLENEDIKEKYRKFFLLLDFAIAPLLGYVWFLFCYYFLENKKLKKIYHLFFIFLIAVLNGLLFSGYIINNIKADKEIIEFDYNIFFALYAVYLIFSFIGGPIILYFKYKKLTGNKREQVLFILYGFFFTAVFGLSINLFFQKHLPVNLFRISTYCLTIFIGFTAYAIIKHRLFDLRSIIARGIIYFGVLGIFIGFYMLLVFAIGYIFQKTTNMTILFAAILTSLVGITTTQPLKRVFRKFTDKIFYKDKYDYSQAVYEISQVLNKNIGLEKLLLEMVGKMKEIFKASAVIVILPRENLIYGEQGFLGKNTESIPTEIIREIEENPSPLIITSRDLGEEVYKISEGEDKRQESEKIIYFFKKYDIETAVYIMAEKKLIGVILMKEKLSGDIYTQEDISLLRTLSYQVSVALERARLFEEVKKYSLELEKKVEARTAKIKKLQEEQKKIMLEIAHGLQTPLTIIKSELSGLSSNEVNLNKVRNLERNINRISNFIYGMLRLARLETSQSGVIFQKVNLSELLVELIESFTVIAQDRKIKIDSFIKPGIFVLGDRHELAELATNLVSNSIKYMGDSKKRQIKIYLLGINGQAFLTVADTGSGIDAKDLPFLFDRFYRGEKTVENENTGVGLGLAICERIVKRHFGNISVKSKVGIGSVFKVVLPIVN